MGLPTSVGNFEGRGSAGSGAGASAMVDDLSQYAAKVEKEDHNIEIPPRNKILELAKNDPQKTANIKAIYIRPQYFLLAAMLILLGETHTFARGYGGISYTSKSYDYQYETNANGDKSKSDISATGSLFKFYIGYYLYEDIILEGGYIDFGQPNDKKNTGWQYGNAVIKLFPIGTTNFSVNAGLGAMLTSVGVASKLEIPEQSYSDSQSKQKMNVSLIYGGGIEYSINRSLALNLNYDVYTKPIDKLETPAFKDTNITTQVSMKDLGILSFGFKFSF
ncbi:hypothetical protein CHS0354_035287 [Potamilus streckersoni]|uniref:Outer membrane protein OmpA-like transmembrane domain-containing protein n=1 Tax=Potamilus streckersoni TaxID=2493646 RepID=A0AAE0VNK9_9BIVA|nr:hypothetical protein CHS0354_035287 [Potamilus streckersoni]